MSYCMTKLRAIKLWTYAKYKKFTRVSKNDMLIY